MVGEVVQVVSLVAVAVTTYFAGMQAQRLRKQITISNLFSRYEALNHASERYDAGLALIFQRPDLRPYIFDGKPLDLDGDELARLLTVADLMAGAVDYALRVGSRFPDVGSDWTGVAVEMTKQPAFRVLVLSRPHEFPDLVQHFERPAVTED
ncbi:hypothetical protein [Actinoplanes sp. DH11]|uniref:hypothetical protein n=1 Tax=Actinoplanes sp. DH11 TaxID=2857011 RepID=UPI001E369A2A|nr:hypothetical protein [Actinoplanes sp. DH11]